MTHTNPTGPYGYVPAQAVHTHGGGCCFEWWNLKLTCIWHVRRLVKHLEPCFQLSASAKIQLPNSVPEKKSELVAKCCIQIIGLRSRLSRRGREGSHAAARGRDGTAARARVRAAAVAAAANSGPIAHRYYQVTFGGRVTPPPAIRRLTACEIAGCVGHASVNCDCGPCAWGPGERARCVFHSSSSVSAGGPVCWERPTSFQA